MASLNVSIQASCLGRTLQENTYTAAQVIDVTDACMQKLNLLTLDNPNTGGNCVTTIQANQFLPIMYAPNINAAYAYYGCSFCACLDGTCREYFKQSENSIYVAWADASGQYCAYTQCIPTTTTPINVACDKDFSECYSVTINCTNIQTSPKSVENNYTCNYKINEANIPYLSADLITHGEIPVTVIPKAETLTGSNLETTLPTKGAVVDGIAGMARAISYNNGILALWGYGDDGNLYITSAVSLGVTQSVDNQTLPDFQKSYPLA